MARGGGRYVYDLRREFDLFLKISPINALYGPVGASVIKPAALIDVDIVIARDNIGGVYQGTWHELNSPRTGREAHHEFSYSASQVLRILTISARLAAKRRRKLAVAWKESGVPSISELWRDCARSAAERFDVELRMFDIDFLAYSLVASPGAFDVIAAPNLFGDVLSDLGGLLVGSRGNTFSGNYSSDGAAVYQTNHGAAYDIAGKDIANPAGQIFSLAMLLRESFGLATEAKAVEQAVRDVWAENYRTRDAANEDARIVGCREMGELVGERAAFLLSGRRDADRDSVLVSG